MVFSSLLFLFWFIPIFFLIYYISPAKVRNLVLFIGSVVFYSFGEPKYIYLLILSILVNYLAGICIEHFRARRKICIAFFAGSIFYNLLMLLFFKYVNFFIDNINSLFDTNISSVSLVLPLGISFYTFQIMSYIIDLYRGNVKCEKNLLSLGTYLCMFPQLIAGPIVVYQDVSTALKSRNVSLDDIEEGIRIFILGLGSKVIIANNVGMLWDEIGVLGYDRISIPLAWLGAVAFTLQIFFDFNGYSLMAIGLGRLLGFNFPKNFNYPYIASSITEFWRRWHITLSSWFREYVYIPLGGNRKGKIRTYVNLFIVWFLTGFWHGASWNFILWGLFFFVLLCIERMGLLRLLEKRRVLSHIYTLFFVTISWVIFAITKLDVLGSYLRSMFGGGFSVDFVYYLRNYGLILLIGILLSTPVFSKAYERWKKKAVGVVFHVLVLLICVAYLADASYNPFLYFRF